MTRLAAAALALCLLSSAGAAESDLQISRAGSRSVSPAPAQNFSGAATVEMLRTPAGPDRASVGTVSFAPGARTAWHTHPLGQTLVITAGVGRVQRWGGPVEEMQAGDVVRIAPNVKHWHGAAPGSAMTHLAITEAQDGKTVDWLELVTGAQYGVPRAAAVSALIALNRPEQLRSHMTLGRNNGLSKDERVETLTHLAFYTGWPNADSAVGVAREVFATKP